MVGYKLVIYRLMCSYNNYYVVVSQYRADRHTCDPVKFVESSCERSMFFYLSRVYILKYSLGAAEMAPPAKNDMCTQTLSE